MNDTLMSTTSIIKKYRIRSVQRYIHALKGVSLSIQSNTIHGLVGESGCGKTTLGRIVSGLIKPDEGMVCYQGRALSSIHRKDRNIQYIFQDPRDSLDPRYCVQEIIGEGLFGRRVGSQESRLAKIRAILEAVGLHADTLRRSPHQFSGGERQRLVIARALVTQPELVVCDEPVSSLDVSVQAQILNLLLELKIKHRLSYLFISHDLHVVRFMADQITVMYLGKVVEEGPAEDVYQKPLHPYTCLLIQSIPVIGKKLVPLPQRIDAVESIGCAFFPRCPFGQPLCAKEDPPLRRLEGYPDRSTACHFAELLTRS
ncbi:MAG: ABC transporter ATP-binding protein [Chlamydiota bacterium]|nr:ABC transporter ATP-binding protein [Chlamydiota bacterium]